MTSNAASPLVSIDLGCGRAKKPGFLGLDRYPLPNVDVVADLDRRLPFADDSVDRVFASHSLEHVSDLMHTMREIYRACRHGAHVGIVSPYHEQKLNLANPYHSQVFNEHTPRFWTDDASCSRLSPDVYDHPHAPHWGLSRSDHSDPGIDFRLLSLSFAYFPEYRPLPEALRGPLRRSLSDVCHEIAYHLVVVKRPVSDQELAALAAGQPPFELPPGFECEVSGQEGAGQRSVAGLLHGLWDQIPQLLARQMERNTVLQDELHSLAQQLAERDEAGRREREVASRQLAELQEALGTAGRENERLRVEREETQRLVAALRAERAPLIAELDRRQLLVAELRSELNGVETEISGLKAMRSQREALLSAHQQGLLGELEGLRSRRGGFIAKLKPVHDLWTQIAPAYLVLKRQSEIDGRRTRAWSLTLSPDLRSVPFVPYTLEARSGRLVGLSLAPVADRADEPGELGVELVLPEGRIVSNAVAPLAWHRAGTPFALRLPEFVEVGPSGLQLRVFARGCHAAVRLFELRPPRWRRGNPLARRPFCHLEWA